MSKNKKKEAREKQDHAGRERNTYLKKITYKDVKNSEEVNAYIKKEMRRLGGSGLPTIPNIMLSKWLRRHHGF